MSRLRLCQNCGAPNRIPEYFLHLRPLCGKCKSPLLEPVGVRAYRLVRSAKIGIRLRWLLVGTVLGGTLTFLVSQPDIPGHGSPGPSIVHDKPAPEIQPPPATYRPDERRVKEPEPTERHPPSPPVGPPQQKVAPRPLLPAFPALPTIEYVDMPNGFVFHNALEAGDGRLTIINGAGVHAIAKLISLAQGKSLHTVLIRSHEQASITEIPDGTYRLLFALGKGWNEEQ